MCQREQRNQHPEQHLHQQGRQPHAWKTAEPGEAREAFIEAGIVEPNILKYMEANGMTTLRPASVKKPKRAKSSGDPIPEEALRELTVGGNDD